MTTPNHGVLTGLAQSGTEPVSPEPCVGCGSPCNTPFCAQCGEQRASDRHYTIMHFGEEVIETFTHADGRLMRSIRALVDCPGEMTKAYMLGRRKRYVGPLQLFLILNVVFFVTGSLGLGSDVFSTRLKYQMMKGRLAPHAEWATHLVNQRLSTRQTSLQAYSSIFDHATVTQAKSLVIAMVPAFAVLVGMVMFPRRRYVVQHLVFSLHAYAMLFVIIMATVAVMDIAELVTLVTGRQLSLSYDAMASPIIVAAFGIYVARALRCAYGDSLAASTTRAVVLTLALPVLLVWYRVLLFFVTFLAT